MARYVTRSRSAWVDDDMWSEPMRNELVVTVSEPVCTGLLDAEGNSIFRLPNPIGFGRDEEW